MTIDVLAHYVEALGAKLDVSVVQGRRRTPLLSTRAAKRTYKARKPGQRQATTKQQSITPQPSPTQATLTVE